MKGVYPVRGLARITYFNKGNTRKIVLICLYVALSNYIYAMKVLPPLIYYLLMLTYCAMGYVVLMYIIDAVIKLSRWLKLWDIKKYLSKNN